jgi:hypothetical protein
LEGIRHTEAANDLFVEVAVESGRYWESPTIVRCGKP